MYYFLTWAAVMIGFTMVSMRLTPIDQIKDGSGLEEDASKRQGELGQDKPSLLEDGFAGPGSGAGSTSRRAESVKKRDRWFPHRLGFLDLLEFDPDGELDATSSLDVSESRDEATRSLASVTEKLALEEIGAELLGTAIRNQV